MCANILQSFKDLHCFGVVWFMVFNSTFKDISVISWRSVLLLEETRVPGKNQRHLDFALADLIDHAIFNILNTFATRPFLYFDRLLESNMLLP
jgi:hypothetical protein